MIPSPRPFSNPQNPRTAEEQRWIDAHAAAIAARLKSAPLDPGICELSQSTLQMMSDLYLAAWQTLQIARHWHAFTGNPAFAAVADEIESTLYNLNQPRPSELPVTSPNP